MATPLSRIFDRIKAAWPKPIDLTDEDLVEVTSWLLSHFQHQGVWPKRFRKVADYNQRKRDGIAESPKHPPVAPPRSRHWRHPLDPTRLSGSGSGPRQA